jgi:serine/threonine protein kinase
MLVRCLLTISRQLFDRAHDGLSRVVRDLQPANLVVKGDGTMKLIDLGGVIPEGIVVPDGFRGRFLGSGLIVHQAPEVMLGDRPIDRRADYFSLAATAHSILARRAAYSNRERDPETAKRRYAAEYRDAAFRLRNEGLRSGIERETLDFLEACLHPDPEQRPRAFELQSECTPTVAVSSAQSIA